MTTKPWCCYISDEGVSCAKDADYRIVNPKLPYDICYTDSCKEHVGDFWEEGYELKDLDWQPWMCSHTLRIVEND